KVTVAMEVNLTQYKLGVWILPLLLLWKVDISRNACPEEAPPPGACGAAPSPTDSSSDNGWAEVLQRSDCGNSYSILQSPLLNFDTAACLEFFFSSVLPAKLDVFLVLKNGTAVEVYNERNVQNPNRPLQYTLEPHQSAKIAVLTMIFVAGACTLGAGRYQSGLGNLSQVNFESHSTDPQAIIAVDAVAYRRNAPGCKFLPESVPPDYHLVTKPRPIFTTTPSGPATKSRRRQTTSRAWRQNTQEVDLSEDYSAPGYVHDPDYSYTTDTELNSNKPYIDPYELADDGAPGKTRGLVTDEYNVLNVHGVGKDLHNPHGADNDNYSHISSQPTELDVSALYSQVQKKGKGPTNKQQPAAAGPDPGAVYSQVQKTGKGAATPQHLTAADGALYSQVQKKGKKPLTAQKPGVAQKPAVGKKPTATDDYNRINFSESQPAGSADGVLDTYNRLEDVNV
ncbi:hypothetical protein BaRGS_00029181, partial [Batillaria attramentaria]